MQTAALIGMGILLNPERFDEFFFEVRGVRPFPWQSRLARRVMDGGGWPPVIALPTGAGKSSVVDIAVYAMAAAGCRAGRPPRRIFFVVDRRVVVDEVYRQACRLAERLEEGLREGRGVVWEVAVALQELGGEVPLQVEVLRGGLYLDHDWARDPSQPLVCVSTVDQVGSRLLWRGYGLNPEKPNNLLPIHAALVGNDALIFVDEAHLSAPFIETLRWIQRYRGWADRPLSLPWQVVEMTATPVPDGAEVYRESDEDWNHPELGQRLKAKKPARLVEVETQPPDAEANRHAARLAGERNRRALVETLCREAEALLNAGEGRVVAVVANQVSTARAIFEQLGRLRPDVARILLMGRVRPLDRDRLMEQWKDRLFSKRTRSPSDPPCFVVATQAIEVGADFDFDALVTECAALDALRQRFGRLDRLGCLGQSEAVIAIRSDHAARTYSDPIYGDALRRTWAWLQQVASGPAGRKRGRGSDGRAVDMGVEALARILPEGEELEALCSPRRRAPVLLPGHLDLWVQTSPTPHPDPDVSLFLHGPDAGQPDVLLVWRAELDVFDPDQWADVVALLPPLSLEAMPVPLVAVQQWLAGHAFDGFADVEGPTVDRDAEEDRQPRPALRWAGPLSKATGPVQSPGEIRPGDTLVVPCSYGGADQFGWHPASTTPVTDLAAAAYWNARRTYVLRLHPRMLGALVEPGQEDILDELRHRLEEWMVAVARDDDSADAIEDELLDWIASTEGVLTEARKAASELAGRPRRRVTYPTYPGEQVPPGAILMGQASGAAHGGVLTDEDESSSFVRSSTPVSLKDHQACVAELVRRFASKCGLPQELIRDLELAARLHDLGKLDPRFQVLLHGGDEVEVARSGEPLAKSSMGTQNPAAVRRAWERAGLPPGYRHEATSVALVQSAPAVLAQASDKDLVLHLIASHHGCARPFFPPVADEGWESCPIRWGEHEGRPPRDGLGRVDSGVAERFWCLVRRYGWYGLAYLEAILRLADHRCSERGR